MRNACDHRQDVLSTEPSIPLKAPGRYFTRDQRLAIIDRIDAGRAFGRVSETFADGTWWYVNGEHALCPIDDLVAEHPDRSIQRKRKIKQP